MDKDLLLTLFSVCNKQGCGVHVDRDDIRMTARGGAVSIVAPCSNSHEFKWSSSPKVGVARKQMFKIKVELASYVVLCGLDISQVIQLIWLGL